jgi:(p)ppGpp synthase/HD superfamily hydrolase
MNYQRINNALEYAAIMHHDQRYKFNSGHFQIAHVSFAGAVLLRHGFSDDVVIAGILHDVVEDTKAVIEDVRQRFGETVATYVAAETIAQSLPWKERQHLMQDNARNASPEVKAIKTADLLHQLVLFNDPNHKDSQENYFVDHQPVEVYWKFEQLLIALGTGWSHPMLDEAMTLLKQMKKKHI